MTEKLKNSLFISLVDYLVYINYLVNTNSGNPILIKFNRINFFKNKDIDTILKLENAIYLDTTLKKIIKHINFLKEGVVINFYDILFSLILEFYNINFINNEDISLKVSILLKNIDKLDINIRFYIYWYSLKLFPYKLITIDKLIKNYNEVYKLESNNPYFLLDYSRLLGIHLWNITRDKKYINLSIGYIKKSLKILKKENYKIKGYMLSWLGAAYRHKGDYNLALYYIERGILLNRKEIELYELPYYWKLSLLGELGLYNKQFKFGKWLINNGFNSFRIYKALANSYIKLGNQHKVKYNIIKSLDILLNNSLIEINEGNSSVFIGYKNNKFKYDLSLLHNKNTIIFNTIDELIKFIGEKYKKIVYGKGKIHFVETFYIERTCFNYLQLIYEGKNK